MSAPFSLSLHPSRCECVLAGVGHCLPLLALAAEGVPGWMKGVVFALLLLSAGLTLRRLRRARGRVLRVSAAGELELCSPEGAAQVAQLCAPPRLLGPWVELRVAAGEGARPRALLLWRCAQDQEAWRSLQCWVRLRGWQASLRAADPSA